MEEAFEFEFEFDGELGFEWGGEREFGGGCGTRACLHGC